MRDLLRDDLDIILEEVDTELEELVNGDSSCLDIELGESLSIRVTREMLMKEGEYEIEGEDIWYLMELSGYATVLAPEFDTCSSYMGPLQTDISDDTLPELTGDLKELIVSFLDDFFTEVDKENEEEDWDEECEEIASEMFDLVKPEDVSN